MSRVRNGIEAELETLRELLNGVAGGDPPNREHAVIYANCRGALLASEQGKMLPGFLYQCATIDRFREFIHLYDPEIDLRRQFVDRMIDRTQPLQARVVHRRTASPSTWEF